MTHDPIGPIQPTNSFHGGKLFVLGRSKLLWPKIKVRACFGPLSALRKRLDLLSLSFWIDFFPIKPKPTH